MKKFISFLSIALLSFVVIAGCASQNGVQPGDTVTITYTATFSDGKVFEEHTDQVPLIFTIGSGQVIPGLDEGIVGVAVGKSKIITITHDKGYGNLYNPHNAQKIAKFIFDQLNITPENGSTHTLGDITGIVRGTETDASGNVLVLFDINPRQTWDTLTYNVTILSKNGMTTK